MSYNRIFQYATLKIERQQLQEYLDTLLANILERDPRWVIKLILMTNDDHQHESFILD